ncbi:MAG: L-seryl-tRNA(Sec) selenium transferase [Desulfamplus sp.]|nr:L-seryl-tRNA(Sec) selenium transferase [Desulfamplus sp.]
MDKNALQRVLQKIPKVDYLLEKIEAVPDFSSIPISVIKASTRKSLEIIRNSILKGWEDGQKNGVDLELFAHQFRDEIGEDKIIQNILSDARKTIAQRLVPTINATGVVIHTNLGRSILCQDALDRITQIAGGFSNLEFNIKMGKRGERYSAIEEILCELTGAESAMAVNNNAGAVFLSLNTLAKDREVVVSRGELVEIGGSFRIPDVMEKSGCKLKEVGTTNRTHLKDYQSAIGDNTALLLKVHTSNYKIEGFTKSVTLSELALLAKQHQLPVMEDLGSGSLIDLSKYGLAAEPTVSDVVAAGADVVTFSGDKLLGGPQAGLIVGRADVIKQIKSNPLTRALRIDKLTLAALEATLNLYRDEAKAIKEIPTLRMLTMPFDETVKRAEKLLSGIKSVIEKEESNIVKAVVGFADLSSRTGGGSYPEYSIPSRCITIEPKLISASLLEKRMRNYEPSIIGRIENDRFIIDTRTLQSGEDEIICKALAEILGT